MKRAMFLVVAILMMSFVAGAQNIPAYTANKLMARVAHNDTTYILNFWASWCAPCVKELPQFEQLQQKYAGTKVKVLLVSFDFPDSYPEKLTAYVEKKKITPEVVWFSETNANEFIPKIANEWSGGLPGTMIVQGRSKYRLFMEKVVTAEEISAIVDGLRK
jgi:thiol-disulfide isomerase/thioredoxin